MTNEVSLRGPVIVIFELEKTNMKNVMISALQLYVRELEVPCVSHDILSTLFYASLSDKVYPHTLNL